MASPGTGMGVPAPAPPETVQLKLRLEHALRGSASWFLWVAGLSIVNSILSLTGASIRFIFGMGATQVVDAIAHQAGSAGFVLDLIINGIIAGIFVLFWNFARKGQRWAWIVGMALYLVDGLILIPFQDYLGVAFHAYVLFRLYQGFKLVSMYESLQRQEATGAVSSTIG